MLFRQLHQGVEIDLAGRHQRDVARAVALVEIVAHRRDRQLPHAFQRSQHAVPQRMIAEVDRLAEVVHAKGGLILIHLDLFQDHLLLGDKVFFAQRRPHDVGQQLQRLGLKLRQDRGVVDGLLFAGKRVVMRPHLVELAIYVVRRPARGPLEQHVLEKMADPGHIGRFITGAGLHEETQRHRMRPRIALGYHFQAIGQHVLTKLQRAPPTAQALA